RSVQGHRPAQRTLTADRRRCYPALQEGSHFQSATTKQSSNWIARRALAGCPKTEALSSAPALEQHQPGRFGRGLLPGKMPADSYRLTHLRFEALNRVGAVKEFADLVPTHGLLLDPLNDGGVCGAPWHRYLPSTRCDPRCSGIAFDDPRGSRT